MILISYLKVNEDVKIEIASRIPNQTEDKSTQCNIQLEVILRSHPMTSIEDHVYFRAPAEFDPPLTAISKKQNR